jgi:hypothetical protein
VSCVEDFLSEDLLSFLGEVLGCGKNMAERFRH